MTTRLIRSIQEQSLRRTFVSIAAEVGLDEKTIRNIFHDYVAELEKTHVFQTPRWLGIDELLLERLATVYLDQRACGNHHWVTARPHQCHGDTVPERDARPPADRTGLHGYIG